MKRYKQCKGLGLLLILLIFVSIVTACGQGTDQRQSVGGRSTTDSENEADNYTNTGLTMVVASDMHYLAPELTDRGLFFERLVTESDGKVMMYSDELMEAWVDQLLKQQPDVVILSGDLTFNGAKVSHEALAEKLTRLRDAGIKVYVIPGNHDLNSSMAASFEGNGYSFVSSVTGDEFEEIYASFGYSEALSKDPDSCSYMAEPVPGIRLLMMDCNDTDVPGTINESSLTWAEKQLRQAQNDGAMVFAVSHQNLLTHNPIFIQGYRMGRAAELLEIYEKYGVLGNFSGHMHIQHIEESAKGLPEILTSALSITPLHYGVVEISHDSGTDINQDSSVDVGHDSDEAISHADADESGHSQWRYHTETVDVFAWAKEQGMTDENLLSFDEYALHFFRDRSYQQAMSSLEEASEKDADAMANFLADVNTAYFTGTLNQIVWDEELADRWKEMGDSWSVYLRSIEPDKDSVQLEYIGTLN